MRSAENFCGDGLSRRFPQLARQLAIGEQARRRRGQRGGRSFLHEQAICAVLHNFRHAAARQSYHGQGVRHGAEQRGAGAFAQRREEKHIARCVDRIHVLNKSGESDIGNKLRRARLFFERGAQWAVAGEQQPAMRRFTPHCGEGLEQQRVSFFGRERRDKREHPVAGREIPALPRAAPLLRRHRRRHFHAVGDDGDALWIERSGQELFAYRLRYGYDAGRRAIPGQRQVAAREREGHAPRRDQRRAAVRSCEPGCRKRVRFVGVDDVEALLAQTGVAGAVPLPSAALSPLWCEP